MTTMPHFDDIICDIFHVDSLLPSKFSNNEVREETNSMQNKKEQSCF
jgi:hypothetical protein